VVSLATVLLRPLVGAGLDRYGRRPFFLGGVAGYATSMFAFAFASEVWLMIIARTLQGVASALLWLSTQAITADLAVSDERGRAFGRVEQASWQGATVGAVIGYGLLTTLNFAQGWTLLFVGYGAVGLGAALLAWRRIGETQPATSRIKLLPIVWSRPWVLLLLVTAVTGGSASMLSPIIMIFLMDRLGAGVSVLALAYIPAALIGALLPARLGTLADRLGRKPLMVLGMAVAAGTSFLIPGLASLAGLAALWALQTLCYVAGDPAERALVADLTGGDQRGRAYGLYALAAGLGATVGPLAGGWLYTFIGPRAPFYANGLVLALSTLVLAVLLQVPTAESAEGISPEPVTGAFAESIQGADPDESPVD
jgi:DHA1 family multidrug resistance protein-like MFS transporter